MAPIKKENKMILKNNIQEIEKILKNKKQKLVALLAPSFVASFEYPLVVCQLRELGFEKVVELTFGAKMVNREYHNLLKTNKELVISSVCPGITELIKQRYPQYEKNLAKIDSPMVATAKICKKIWPKYKTCFISPCHFKKTEANNSKYLDYSIDYIQLKDLLSRKKITISSCSLHFDKFYNDYTKIYPLSGGLSKTAHLKKVLKKGQEKTIDGIQDVIKFLENPDPKLKFLDITFCKGGCIGGPCTSSLPLDEKRKRVLEYFKISEKEKIPETDKGLIKRAKGIKFTN